MNLELQLTNKIKDAFQAKFNTELKIDQIKLQPTKKEFDGEFTFVVFPFLKQAKTTPEKTAEIIGEYLKSESDLLDSYNVVKGFLNLAINNITWIKTFFAIYSDPEFGTEKPNGEEVMVEYSSPNTNKPLHLGHLRNIFLGFSISKILGAAGNKVHKVQIINDRGIHICKSMVAWSKYGNGETPESSGMKGDKLVGKYYVEFEKRYKAEINDLVARGISKEEAKKEAPLIKEAQETLKKWEEKEPNTYQLWQTMNQWVYNGFDVTYQTMGVNFDKLYFESDTYISGRGEVMEGLQNGKFYKKEDGSIWVDLSDNGLDHKVLLRGDGTSVYMTQDIGTAMLRFSDFPKLKKLIYTVGNEQEYHFKVLFLILKKLGLKWANELYHLAYGMVDLPSGKMKSREGTVVDADDLMQEMIETAEKHTKELGKIDDFNAEQAAELYKTIGLGALKYFLLKVDPRKRMLFNPEESVEFHGNTGPFIQYTHARISAIIRKAEEMGIGFNEKSVDIQLTEYEKPVIFQLYKFPKIIKEAAEELSPSLIANYIYELAKEYNKFYTEVPIFKEENKDLVAFRIAFSAAAGRTIKAGMGLLGINVPERM